jgi:hypothetical protein
MIFIYESPHNKHFFGLFEFSRDFFRQTAAKQIPICLASEISEISPMDQKLSMQQDLPPGAAPLGLAGPSVPSVLKIPKKIYQIAQNKQEFFLIKN